MFRANTLYRLDKGKQSEGKKKCFFRLLRDKIYGNLKALELKKLKSRYGDLKTSFCVVNSFWSPVSDVENAAAFKSAITRASLHVVILLSISHRFQFSQQKSVLSYHRFRWYATLENKTLAETFPKFPSVLRVIDISDRNPPITAR